MRLSTNLKLSVTHLRIVFLVVNLGLAVALPAYAVYSIWPAAGDAKGVEVVDPGAYVYTPVPLTGQTGAQILQVVADWINPRPPATISDNPPGEGLEPAAPDPKAEEVKEGGPLAKDWEYTFYISWGGDALVKLTRKEAEDPAAAGAAAAAGAGAARRPPVRRPQTPRNFNLGRGRQPAGQKAPVAPQDKLAFYVGRGKHHVKNEELGVDFMAHSADETELIYWVPDEGPKKRYRLPFHDSNPFIIHDRTGLMPTATEETEAEGSLYRDPHPNLMDRREDQYQELLEGKIPVSQANLVRDEPAEEGQSTSAGGAAVSPAAAAAKLRAATGGPAKPTNAAEQQKELGKTLQGLESPEAQAKMSKEDKENLKQLKDTLRGKAGTAK